MHRCNNNKDAFQWDAYRPPAGGGGGVTKSQVGGGGGWGGVTKSQVGGGGGGICSDLVPGGRWLNIGVAHLSPPVEQNE